LGFVDPRAHQWEGLSQAVAALYTDDESWSDLSRMELERRAALSGSAVAPPQMV